MRAVFSKLPGLPMTIAELCHPQRDALLSRWTERFFASYPLDGVGFARSNRDPFANPVGHITRSSAAVLLDAVLGGDVEPPAVKAALGDLVRLRAVQDLPPSRAVGPLFLLKQILRELARPELLKNPALLDEYAALEARVDSLALMAFDMYAGDRETVFRLRVEEVKRGQSQITRWAKQRGAPDADASQNCQSER